MKHNLLDDIGISGGTDKSCLRWDYLRQYQEVFRDWRDVEFNLIEIGVSGGASLVAWRKFFTEAQIVGIDINEDDRRCAGDRIAIEIGSQADPSFLASVCAKYPPSIVIDDGSHQADHIMISFHAIFPHLAPGGWYVIEDLNITGGQDKVPITPHIFFTQTALAVINRRQGNHHDPATLSQVDRIDFAPGIIFIRKKDLGARAGRIIESIDRVGRTTHPNNYLWLSEQLAEEETNLQRAEEAAKRAEELYPGAAVYPLGLSRVLQRRKKFPAAIDAALNAIAASPDNFECHYQLAFVLWEAGDATKSHEVFAKSIEVAPDYLRVHIEDRRRTWK